MEISDYTHYTALLSPLLKWNLWLHSLHCFTSLLLNRNLWPHSLRCFTFTTMKTKSVTRLPTLFYFTTIKMKHLTTLTTLFFLTDYSHYTALLSPLLKLNLWLRSLRCFTSLYQNETLYAVLVHWLPSLWCLSSLFWFEVKFWWTLKVSVNKNKENYRFTSKIPRYPS